MLQPGPLFEWRINLGTVVQTVVLGVPVIWTSLKMYWTLTEYTPHKHTTMAEGKRAHTIADTIVTYPAKSGT